jgi:exosortase A
MIFKDVHIDPDRKYAVLAFVAALILLIVAYRETILSIVNVWSHSNTYMHGFLIVPITIWLIWRKRDRLYRTQVAQQPYVIALLLLAVIVWISGNLVDVQIVMHLALITMIPLLVWLFLGRRILYEIAFPLAYLYFAVPIGESIVPYLQDVTAAFTVNALRLTGISVFWEGLYIYIPSGSFEVAEACSGVRFLIASVALGVLYGYLTYHSIWRRLLFALVSIIVPIIANGIRAYGIVMIAHLSDYKLATGVDHILYGWIFFSIVLLLMFWIGSYFRDDNVNEMKYIVNGVETGNRKNVSTKRLILQLLIAVPVLVAGPVAGYWEKTYEGKTASYDFTLPPATNGWEGPLSTVIAWGPRFSGANREITGAYKLNGKQVYIYMAYYYEQGQGDEMISEDNRLYSSNWHKIQGSVVSRKDMSMRRIIIAAGEKRMILRQWYLVDGKSVAGQIMAKIYEARSRLLSRYMGSYVVMLGLDPGANNINTNKAIDRFIADMWPAICTTLLTNNA